MSKYYNEVCDDAQQYLIRGMEKLEKARVYLETNGFQRQSDKASGIIGDIKRCANEIDGLPALDDE